jgi:hypothetical protein
MLCSWTLSEGNLYNRLSAQVSKFHVKDPKIDPIHSAPNSLLNATPPPLPAVNQTFYQDEIHYCFAIALVPRSPFGCQWVSGF